MIFRTGRDLAPDPVFPTRTPPRAVGRSSSRLAAFRKSAVERGFVIVFLIVGAALSLAWTTFLGLVVFRAGQWALG
jgi:hypothetical protein